MKAVILAGGKGTRLRPYTISIPKPLLPIGDISSIELLTRQLAAAGFRDLRVSLAYKGSLIQATLTDGSDLGTQIEYVHESQPLGTAGCLQLIRDWIDSPVLVCNGDLLCDYDFAKIWQAHCADAADITIGVRQQQVAIQFGVVGFDQQHLLTDYDEKPTLAYWVSTGINVIGPKAVDLIEPDERIDMPDLHLRAKRAGLQVKCMPLEGDWFDIGCFEDYERACEAFTARPQQYLPDAKA